MIARFYMPQVVTVDSSLALIIISYYLRGRKLSGIIRLIAREYFRLHITRHL